MALGGVPWRRPGPGLLLRPSGRLPCTNVREFAGKFHEGIKKKELHEVFPYRFDFKMAPRNVTVTLFYNKANDTAWVFVREIVKKA